MTQQSHNHSFDVSGIEEAKSITRYGYFLGCEYEIGIVQDDGQYVLHHCQISMASVQRVTVKVHTTGKITLTASPKLSSAEFQKICGEVESLVRESTETINSAGNLPLTRGHELLGYIGGLGVKDENSRTVVVIVSDTINELVLREILKGLGETGAILRAPVPDKISKIESYSKHVYLKEAIGSLRTFRNDVIHEGRMPSKKEAQTSLETATNVLQHS